MGYNEDMSDLLACEPEASTVRSARRFVIDRLQEWGRDDLVDSAALLTSELVTNAVLHTRKPFTVRVAQRGAHVRIEVADSLHVLPMPPHGGEPGAALDLDHAFRGLTIVDSVASSWGSESIPGDGKIVWFELVGTRDGARPGRTDAGPLSDLRDPVPGFIRRGDDSPMPDRAASDDPGSALRLGPDTPALGWALLLVGVVAIAVIALLLLG